MGLNEIVQIGSKIKRLRKKKGISQKDFAQQVGIPYSTYSNYENNNRTPSKIQLEKIAVALDVNVIDLIGISYFDSVIDTNSLKKEISKIETIENYFNLLGFSLEYEVTEWHWEEEVQIPDKTVYTITTDGKSATFTQEEFDELQASTKEFIEGKFYKKIFQQ